MYKYLALVALGLFSASSWAADCAVTIEGNDMLQFNLETIEVPASCADFTVTLKHVGKLPKASMGHNWVLTSAADEAAVVKDGMAAGLDNDYLKPGDTRILAHTKLIGGGESDSVTFDVGNLAAGNAYAFFCSFPGHAALMKGTLSVVQ